MVISDCQRLSSFKHFCVVLTMTRDVAPRLGYNKPALIESLFFPAVQDHVVVGGVLFKVYIVGDAIKVVRRFSLPDVSKRELSRSVGVFRFPRVSSAAQSADDADLDPCIAELLPRALLERLARELRRRLGLHLFNLDMIREHGTTDRFYVIDINYFPGRKAVNLPVVGCRWWPSKAKHAQKVEKERLNWFSLCYGCTRKEMGATTFLDEREGMRPSIHPRLDLKETRSALPFCQFLSFCCLKLVLELLIIAIAGEEDENWRWSNSWILEVKTLGLGGVAPPKPKNESNISMYEVS
ncbi:hypothetical protein L6452_42197 [Arctium lappa]|uniref:Uncharacterized protein n=1 Tax=Arctium lappa TaxID=4217 RepID=A0ACB8XI28_ARCLA|nr:hypothetical protein L6452_42197 [Arctium lappa]